MVPPLMPVRVLGVGKKPGDCWMNLCCIMLHTSQPAWSLTDSVADTIWFRILGGCTKQLLQSLQAPYSWGHGREWPDAKPGLLQCGPVCDQNRWTMGRSAGSVGKVPWWPISTVMSCCIVVNASGCSGTVSTLSTMTLVRVKCCQSQLTWVALGCFRMEHESHYTHFVSVSSVMRSVSSVVSRCTSDAWFANAL